MDDQDLHSSNSCKEDYPQVENYLVQGDQRQPKSDTLVQQASPFRKTVQPDSTMQEYRQYMHQLIEKQEESSGNEKEPEVDEIEQQINTEGLFSDLPVQRTNTITAANAPAYVSNEQVATSPRFRLDGDQGSSCADINSFYQNEDRFVQRMTDMEHSRSSSPSQMSSYQDENFLRVDRQNYATPHFQREATASSPQTTQNEY
jgi:hypothetical protein